MNQTRAESRSFSSVWTRILLIGGIAAGGVYLWMMMRGLSLDTVVAIPSDDAFYYYKIARNILLGRGCSFDGIAPTNGFHPLWMICLLPIFYLGGPNLDMPVRLVLGLQGLLAVAGIVLIYRFAERHIGPGTGKLASTICCLPVISNAMINGMETGLLLFAIIVLLWLCWEWRIHDLRTGTGSSLLFGMVLGVIVLARLDSVFIVSAAIFMASISALVDRMGVKTILWRLLALCTGLATLVTPYLVWNMASFGRLMPVSGMVKSTFPAFRTSLSFQEDMAVGAVLSVALVILAIMVIIGEYRRGQGRSTIHSPVIFLSLGCVLHYIHAFLFLDWGVYWWHFSVSALVLAVVLAAVAEQVTASCPRVRRVVYPVLIIIVLGMAVSTHIHILQSKYRQHREWLAAAQWAGRNTPPNTIFGIKDAGLFGYFSDRPTINLDGKANSFQYQQYVASDNIPEFLRQVNVTFLADIHARYQEGKSQIHIARPNKSDAVLQLSQADEVYRSAPIPTQSSRLARSTQAHVAIWRLPHDRGLVK